MNKSLRTVFCVLSCVVLVMTAFLQVTAHVYGREEGGEALPLEPQPDYELDPTGLFDEEPEDLPTAPTGNREIQANDRVEPIRGGVSSHFNVATPVISRLGGFSKPPTRVITDHDTVYDTAYGCYHFPHKSPNVVSLYDCHGEAIFPEASFEVHSSLGKFSNRNSNVARSEDDAFESVTDLWLRGTFAGTLLVKTEFFGNQPPKITASLERDVNVSLIDFFIAWRVISEDRFLLDSSEGVMDLQLVDDRRSVELPGASVKFCSQAETCSLSPASVLDWSDADGGRGMVRRTGNSIGKPRWETSISFPSNVPLIDPTMFSIWNDPEATAFEPQRKVFHSQGHYFAFWYSGNHIMYASSNRGTDYTWGPFQSTDSGKVKYGFDVAERNGIVSLAWIDDNVDNVNHMWGIIAQNRIEWLEFGGSSKRVVFQLPHGKASPLTTAIGLNGTIWVAFVHKESSSNIRIKVLKLLIDVNGLPIEEEDLDEWTDFENDGEGQLIDLLPLSSSKMALLHANYGTDSIRFRIRAEGGWDVWKFADIGLEPQSSKIARVSAVADPDDVLHLAYRRYASPTDYLYYARIDTKLSSGFLSTEEITLAADNERPTISIDHRGQLHMVWLTYIAGDGWYFTYKRKTALGWWPMTDVIFKDVSDTRPEYPTLGEFSSETLYGLYTAGSLEKVYFFSVQIPTDTGAEPSDPWNRLGLAPNEYFVSNLDEHVSPGSGLLYLKQSDLVVPGRGGFDLNVERVYSTPPVFWIDPISSELVPFLHEEPTFANFGEGWTLNYPWIGDRYVHLWDGIRYVISFTGSSPAVFESNSGIRFRLLRFDDGHYELITKAGQKCIFNSDGHPTEITGPNTNNGIEFHYDASSHLTEIVDKSGRKIVFQQIGGRILEAEVDATSKRITYNYQTYGSGEKLESVVDSLARTTRFAYGSSQPYLLEKVTYTTGGYAEYHYTPTATSTETTTYLVDSRSVHDGVSYVGGLGILYEMTNGRVVSSNVTQHVFDAISGIFEPSGYTIHVYRGEEKSETIRREDVSGTLLRKVKRWFLPSGDVFQDDYYFGDSNSKAYSTKREFDEFGNAVYSRNEIGHETFASFWNTSKRNLFKGGADLSRNPGGPIGKLIYDDFDELNFLNSGWETMTPDGSVKLDSDVFENRPPSLKLESGDSSYLFAYHFLSPAPDNEFAEFVVKVRAPLPEYARLSFLDSGAATKRSVQFDMDGFLYVWDYDKYVKTTFEYSRQQWYRITMVPEGNAYRVLVNGIELEPSVHPGYYGFGEGSSNPSFTVNLYLRPQSGMSTSMWVDMVKVHEGTGIQINSPSERRFYLFGSSGNLCGMKKGISASFTTGDNTLCYPARLLVTDASGGFEFISTTDLWPGTYAYSPPYERTRLERTESGFLGDVLDNWVDDEFPPNAYEGDFNDYGWEWTTWDREKHPPAASGLDSHVSYSRDGQHEHWFQDVDPGEELHFSSGEFLVQYVFLSQLSLPSEIMLRARENGVDHGAYWGDDSIPGTPKTRIADIPDVTGRWVKLIAKADDIGLSGKDVTGMRYILFGGMAYYDSTSKSPSTSGSIRIQGLESGQKVELIDTDGVKVAEGVATGPDYWLSLYDAGVRVYPFNGFLVIYDLFSSPEHVTPNLEIWGGDEFTYHSTDDPFFNFFPTAWYDQMDVDFHDRLVGQLEFVDGRSADPDDLVLSFHTYEPDGMPHVSKTFNSESFEYAYRFHDSYDNLISEVDPLYNEVTYDYSSTYNYAYLTETTVLGTDITSSFTYNSNTGDLLSETNPRGYTTDYLYDSIGRLIQITYPEVDGYVAGNWYYYYDAENFVVIENENGHCSKVIVDGLGRTTRTERLYDCALPYAPYSYEEFDYDSHGNVISHRIQRGPSDVFEYDFEFDLLGRSTKIVNPDSTFARCEYHGQLSIGPDGQPVSITTCYDEENHKTESLRDLVGRLVEVREYYENSATGYYDAAYTYDEVGNLLAVRDQGGLITHHEYDNVGLLTKTIFPDTTFEDYEYNAVGQLTQKTKRDGRWIWYEYDDAGNMIKEWTPGPPDFTYYSNFSYDLNGNLIHARNGWTYDFGPLSPPDPDDPWYSKIHRQYDARDRLRKETSYIDMDEYDVQYGLDPVGNIMSLTYPDGSVVSYTYDSFERVVSVTDSVRGTIVSQISYTHDDLMSTMEYGNGVLGEHSYYSRGNLAYTTYKKGDEVKRVLDYQYYDDGNVDMISTMQGDDTYFYDYLDRLDYATSDLWGQIDYEYDNAGNRAWVDENGVRTEYTVYDAPNRLMEIVEGGITTTFQYDPNGNMISRTNVAETWTYEYDFRDLVTDIWCAESGYYSSFVFDPLSRLLQENDHATRNYIHAGPHTVMVDRHWEDDTRYIFAGMYLVANVTDSEIHYLHQDHLGSTRLITDETGDSTGDIIINYKPFGEIHLDSTEERQKFTGQLSVPRAGLYVLGVRFYDPSLGRFISEDPVLGSLGVPQTQNRYVYAVNNPLRHTDTSGRLIGIILLTIFILSITVLAYETVQWAQHASWQEAVGMLAGIGVAVLFGVALFFCPVLAIVLIPLAGAMAAVTYIKVTEFLGGTPTQEGVTVAFGWGTVIASIGTTLGLRRQNSVRQGESENPGNNAPDEIDFRPPRPGLRGGREKALAHRPNDIPEAEWIQGVKEIARKPPLQTPNPKGGYRAYGYIAGQRVRVIVGPDGMIITAHPCKVIPWPWYTK